MKKVSLEKERFICKGIAQCKTYKQISDEWVATHQDQKPISKQAINWFVKTRKVLVEDIRQQLIEKSVEKAMEVPIANEKVRLSRMEKLYNEADKIEGVKDKIETSLNCLKEARQEVKGDTGSTQNYLQFNQFNELTDAQLLEKKRELENKFIELSKKGENTYA